MLTGGDLAARGRRVCAPLLMISGPRGIRRPGVGAKDPDPLRRAGTRSQASKLPGSAGIQLCRHTGSPEV